MSNEFVGLPKQTLDAAFALLSEMPAGRSRGVLNAIEAQAYMTTPPPQATPPEGATVVTATVPEEKPEEEGAE